MKRVVPAPVSCFGLGMRVHLPMRLSLAVARAAARIVFPPADASWFTRLRRRQEEPDVCGSAPFRPPQRKFAGGKRDVVLWMHDGRRREGWWRDEWWQLPLTECFTLTWAIWQAAKSHAIGVYAMWDNDRGRDRGPQQVRGECAIITIWHA